MAHTDKISDMIVRLKNARASNKESVLFAHSKLTSAIVDVLERAGYVETLPKKGKKNSKYIEVRFVNEGNTPRFNGARRLSKQSKRMYVKVSNVHSVRSGFGNNIISTPKGILTDKEARTEKVGGEALFQIW